MKTLYVVATPIGNMGDVSKNVIDTLNKVSLIACEDTRTSKVLLNKLDIKTPLISYHKFNEKSQSDNLIKQLLNGSDIALISDAGCPCISDPGSILVRECLNNQIDIYAIPGPSAVITALMVSGFDVDSFTFYGFLERENKKITKELEVISHDSSQLAVIYESPKRLMKTLSKISQVLNNPQVCVCNDLTKKFERKYYGLVDEVMKELDGNANAELGEYVVVIKKNDFVEEAEKVLSIESLLVDTLINHDGITMKDAINMVHENYKYNKNLVYEASLNLKRKLGKFL